MTPLETVDPALLFKHYEEMQQVARDTMRKEGIPNDAIRFEHYADVKYSYQLQELSTAFPINAEASVLREQLAALFREAHAQAFGYNTDDSIELVSLRLRALATIGDLKFSGLAANLDSPSSIGARSEPREAFFGPRHGLLPTPIFRRVDITGNLVGPLIVEEPDTTVVVPPGWTINRDAYGSLVLTKS